MLGSLFEFGVRLADAGGSLGVLAILGLLPADAHPAAWWFAAFMERAVIAALLFLVCLRFPQMPIRRPRLLLLSVFPPLQIVSLWSLAFPNRHARSSALAATLAIVIGALPGSASAGPDYGGAGHLFVVALGIGLGLGALLPAVWVLRAVCIARIAASFGRSRHLHLLVSLLPFGDTIALASLVVGPARFVEAPPR